MRICCTITRLPGGQWQARHESHDIGRIEVQAASREQALEKIRGEIRYRLELCPCSGETYQHIHVEVIES